MTTPSTKEALAADATLKAYNEAMMKTKSTPSKFYKDLVEPLRGEEEVQYFTKFQILTNDKLPFDYRILKDGLCLTDHETDGVELAESYGYIKIIEKKIDQRTRRFNGSPEAILNGGLHFVEPVDGGRDLEIKPFGGWECARCGHVSYLDVSKGVRKPFECFNDTCGRKGPFKEQFPTHLIKPVWKPPFGIIESTATEIYQDIYNFIKEYLVLREEEYHLMTLWIMASWLVDDFQTAGYLTFIAPKNSGKTQALQVLGELAYRAISAISVTAPSLFRAIEMWQITLLIDEAEYQIKQDTEAGQALYGCLNGGYKRGSYALRTEGEGNLRVPASYEVFGFKAIASTQLFHPTLESRSIIINMGKGMPSKILIDQNRAGIIRAKLLFWRFETLNKLPIIYPKSNNGRLIEMFIPLFTVAQTIPNTGGKMLSFSELTQLLDYKITDMEHIRKEEEKSSTEAQIIEAIKKLRQECRGTFSDECTSITVKQIAEYLKENFAWEEKPGKNTLATSIGRKLKVMGIHTEHKKHGNSIELDAPTITTLDKLEKRFL